MTVGICDPPIIYKKMILLMLGEDSMRAMKLPFCREQFKTGRGKTIPNVETIWILKQFLEGGL